MKQVININFQGQVVPIEVSAFELLKNYTESLNRHFANEVGKEEIINDIENRIGELFQQRLKNGTTCITDDDVNAVIKSMGRPEDFDSVEENPSAQNKQSEPDSSKQTYQDTGSTATNKRLFRDENHKVLGGVCSGFANYFGIDSVIVRIITVIFFGVTFLPYIILWIALPSTASVQIGSTRKKLYRDGDDKIVAGVCSGIANYFSINVWIPRVLFLLPFLSFAFHHNPWGFMNVPGFFSFSFSPGSLMVYIILWLVLPEAVTTAEKLQMKGEKVDMNSIKNSVVEEMKGVKQRAEKFGQEAKAFAEEKGKPFVADLGNVAKKSSRSLGDIIIIIIKAFAYFIIGIVAISLIVALFAIAIAAIAVFPLKDFIITDGWQNIYAWGTLLFFIAIPVIGIITWIIRRLIRVKSNGKIMRFTFISLWIVGWISFILLISFVSKDFSATNDMAIQAVTLQNPTVSKLEITSPNNIIGYNYKNNAFRFTPFLNITDEDTLYINAVHFRIVKSKNDSFQVLIIKLADGSNRREAENTASNINYVFTQSDSLLKSPLGIAINKRNKFRNQHVIITIAVPVGKRLRIDQSIWETSSGRFNINWDNEDWQDYWGDEEHGWTPNVDYIMKADGLYTLDGFRATDGNRSSKINIGNDGIDINDRNNRVKINSNGVSITTDQLEDIKQQKIDSLQQEADREKDSIERKIEKEKEKIQKENQSAAYMKPTGLAVINSFM